MQTNARIEQVKSEASSAPELARPGAPEGNKNAARDRNKADNIRIDSEYGTSQSYLARRLRRDAPKIFAKLETYPSVRAAALEAGIVKRMIQLEPTVEGFEKAIRKSLDGDQIKRLKEQL